MFENIFSGNFRVGIFGGGLSGKATAEWCARHGINFAIFDQDGGAEFTGEIATSFDLIVRSPSFLNDHPWVILARRGKVACIGELDLAAKFWRGKIVAVTGTDGKTTTVEFLKHSLRSIGCQAVAVGNIGCPFIGAADDNAANARDSWAIVEVSSFQAQQLQMMRPDYLLWTNFAPDHLDKHRSMGEYFAAKYRLVEVAKFRDGEHVFIGKSVENYAKNRPEFDLLNDATICGEGDVPDSSCLNIPVQRKNFALVENFWNANCFEVERLKAAAETFRLPKHRLQKINSIGKVGANGDRFSVEFWNDSKATNFHAFKAALDSFDRKLILIVGGKSKNEDVEQHIAALLTCAKALFLFGEMGRVIFDALDERNLRGAFESCEFFGDERSNSQDIMRNIVGSAFSVASAEDVVLLCPGFSSLDMFTGYDQRGCMYEECVDGLIGDECT
ncbi:MAG: UDP-N-acetylmuramoyl-L-alanine--D-glutamate ligase [Puniceicoccales bacterium]|jgi:UDP-N-acetylmuramoylalanine--D-glutamate ligase|nr:UDP-N-acetylmuramoyl-L-alanine--D-glutamate ligase [Puniceicoccales bacterium]